MAGAHDPRRAIAALAITEPDAGSDVAAITTVASARGRQFVVNGRKIFIATVPAATGRSW